MIFCIFYFSNLFIQRVLSNQGLFQDFNSSIFLNQKEENQSLNNKVNNIIAQYTITNENTTTNKTTKSSLKQNTSANSITNKTNSQSNINASKLSYAEDDEWKIVIPSIDLDAPICDGTSSEVMDEFVGHFENTAFLKGNVGLAAHNRGYPVNYFANIKNLEVGEIIQYYYHGKTMKYAIQTVTIIDDTDWTYLSNTSDNRITLITCVEDEPEYRRCIQAVEI